jgi:hypothetical protein
MEHIQISNLQNCFTSPNKTLEVRGLRHLPPSPLTGQSLRKADIEGLVSLQIFGKWVLLSCQEGSLRLPAFI